MEKSYFSASVYLFLAENLIFWPRRDYFGPKADTTPAYTGWRKIISLAIIVEFPNSVSAILYAVWDIACELVRQPVRATKNFLKNPLVPPWKFAQKSCGHPFGNFSHGRAGGQARKQCPIRRKEWPK